MPQRARIIAVYPGSFDPVTFGHLDVIRRGAQLFDRLVVGVGQNPEKESWFSHGERLAMLEPHLETLRNVRAEGYEGLTVDFVRRVGGRVLLRGIRDQIDLSDELHQANVNLLVGEIETVFLMTSDQHVLTSSTYIKQIYELGGGDLARIERLVPPNVVDRLEERMRRNGVRRRRSRRRN
ncbi:MAG: Phosphopantetheine adenylyltransferase [Phycisphaerae bacterium]|nr:Phosphopantetheine adenylyltransferase [Phycisphaerae bacterium]